MKKVYFLLMMLMMAGVGWGQTSIATTGSWVRTTARPVTSYQSNIITVIESIPPTITLDPASTSLCEGETSANLNYSATTESPDVYSLDYADGTITDVTDATLTGSPIILVLPNTLSPGSYTADLTVKNSTTGFTSIVYTVTVTVQAFSDAPVINTPCANSNTIDGTSGEGDGTVITVYVNNSSIGTTTVMGGAWSINANLVSGDQLEATAQASGECVSIFSNSVLVNALPTAIIDGDNGPVCPGDNAEFILTGTSGASVTYTINGGPDQFVTLAGGTATIIINGVTSDQALDLVSITDGVCSESLSASSTILVNVLPTASISGNNGPVCPGADAEFYLTGTGEATVTYSINGGSDQFVVLTGGSATVTIFGPTNIQTLDLISITDGACSQSLTGSSVITIKTGSTDPTGAIANNSDYCPGSNTSNLTVQGGSLGTGADWVWYEGGCASGLPIGTGATINVSPAVTTTYYVRAEGDCNMTACATVTVVIKTISTDPTGIDVFGAPACPGSPVILIVQGGSLGEGADWVWYTGGCGGSMIGTGSSIIVNPVSSTTYWVRATGTCNTTNCATVTVNVKVLSTAPLQANSSNNNFCPGGSTLLSQVGGTLGTNAEYYWYSGSCGGTFEGAGSTLTVFPGFTTTYYVWAVGDCNTTSCASVTVTVLEPATDPAGAVAVSPSICPGGNTDISVVGGSLGTNAAWEWFSNSCLSGTPVGTGPTINVSPASTTTYYVRAIGICGSTNCASVTVTIKTLSVAPTGGTVANNNYCQGDNTDITVTGGALGTGADWQWYTGSCGGTLVGTGSTINVNPTVTTTYYVRAEGDCNTTSCATITVTVNPAATVNAGSNQSICATSTVLLNGSVGGSATSGTWSGGAGTFTPNNTTLNASYSPTAGEISTGFVTLTLTTDDPAGSCGSVSGNVIIFFTPAATANAGGNQDVCASSPAVTLNGSVGGSASSGTWSGGAGAFSPNTNTLNAVYTPTAGEIAAGTVTLTLTTNDPPGPCNAVSANMTITINAVATVNAGGNQTICAGNSATLNGSVGGSATSGTWSGGAGTFTPNNTTLNASYTPTAGEISAGSVTLTLTSNDPPGPCNAVSANMTITFGAAATANAGGNQTVCAGSTVTLSGSVGGSATGGTWSGGAGTFSPNATTLTAVYTPTAGEITSGAVTLTLTTSGGCTSANSSMTATFTSSAIFLAGSPGGGQVCRNMNVGTGAMYSDMSCSPIARIVPNGANPVSGMVNVCVTIDPFVQSFMGEAYVQRHFDITPGVNQQATGTARVTVFADQFEFNAYNAANGSEPDLPTGPGDGPGISNLRIAKYSGNGTAPGNYSPGVLTLINPADADIVWNAGTSWWEISFDVNGFSGFFIKSGSSVLPVNLTSFSGYKSGNVNKLQWTTSSESNNVGFEVQRSTDGVNYSGIGFVNTLAPGGTSATNLNYNFTDNSVTGNKHFYRLRQVDIDNRSRMSNVVLIKGDKPVTLAIDGLFPNPATSIVNVLIAAPTKDKVTLMVTDLAGRVVIQQLVNVETGSNTIPVNIDRLSNGTYLVKLVCSSNCETAVGKFVKQ